jgi:surface protein
MFFSNSSFNQDLSTWNVTGVTDMTNMFYAASAFNNDGNANINNWQTLSLQQMNQMFAYSPFNQPIGDWNVSNVRELRYVFWGNSSFNQSLENWGTQVQFCQDFEGLFSFATDFNQPLSGWNVGYSTNFIKFFENKDSSNYSTENTTSLLQNWGSQVLQTSVTLDLGNIDILDTDLSYISILQGKGWTVNYGNVIYTYSAGYDVSNPTNACSATPSIYYSSASTLSNLGYIFTDTTYTTPAPNGVYCLTCPNNSGIETFSINSSLANPGQLFSVTTCP